MHMRLWIVYALLSAFFAALVALLAKKGFGDLGDLDTTLATTIRALIMAVFLVFISSYLHKFTLLHTIQNRDFVFIVLSGIAGALSWLCYFAALQHVPNTRVSAVAALDRLSVVFVLILSVLFLHEKITVIKLIGMVLITLGAIFMTV
jgi:bacterial/archaeal transporter family protein